ncbi:hypothetical protein C1645_838091 [Glomus cerebriforme]|uniref:Uncharacterized protein n=1 Tax=Glomus cerebriforme TaxID=658196 RepID=A0A397S9W8_9GLOM|nr:hypothetical protein C1645_838091 [Glomus cerebriforme]
MASKICCLLYYSTEYTLFTRFYIGEGFFIRLYTGGEFVKKIGDKRWNFGKKKKARSLTGKEIILGQIKEIGEYLNLKKPEKSGGIEIKIIVKNILENEIYLKSSVCDMDYECERALVSTCTETKEEKININKKKIAKAFILFITRNLSRIENEYQFDILAPLEELKTKFENETVVKIGQELLLDFDKNLFTKVKNYAELEEKLSIVNGAVIRGMLRNEHFGSTPGGKWDKWDKWRGTNTSAQLLENRTLWLNS